LQPIGSFGFEIDIFGFEAGSFGSAKRFLEPFAVIWIASVARSWELLCESPDLIATRISVIRDLMPSGDSG
jgi:hypothetical protein